MSRTGMVRWSATLVVAAWGVVFAQGTEAGKQLMEGRSLRAMGRYGEAERVLEGLLRQAGPSGEEPVFVAAVLDNLALTKEDLGDFAAAENLLTRALKVNRGSADAEGHLGELYLEEGRPREAESLFRQALESRQNASESDPINLAVALADLAMVYKYQRKFGEAEKLLRQGFAILEEKLSPDDPMLTSVLSPLCATLTAEGKYREALTLTERTWQILSKDPRVAEPDLLNTMSTLGMLYSMTGRFTEAEFYAKEAVTKAEAIYGTDHPRFGWHLANYAVVLKRMGRKADARAMESRSAGILARSGSGRASQHTVNVNALR